MKEHESLFINNEWRHASGSTFSSYNPATGDALWEGKQASQQEVAEAVAAAQYAFVEWSSLPITDRTGYLSKFSALVRNEQRKLAECISQETGKPLWESISEVGLMIDKVEISFQAYNQRCATIVRDLADARSTTRHRPHGVLAVLGPYNFPGHLPNGHIVPALLAGNTIVFKPSELTPLVAEETMRLWQKAGLPKGVLNMVQGERETGQFLIQHSDINGILFTGSYATGQMLAETIGSQTSKILALEMGGNNPLIIGEIDHVQAAAYITLRSAFLSAGQRCTCARRLFVQNDAKGADFLHELIKMMQRISIGPYTQTPEPFMGPVISEKHAKKIMEAEKKLRDKGGISLVEMRHLYPNTGFLSPGLMDVTLVRDRPDEEIFGPFLQVIRVGDLREAVEEANHTKFGLSAGLLSQKQEEYEYFYHHIRAGLINWNTPLVGATSTAPFGGIKCSGNFRPSAYYAADYSAYPVASWEYPELKMPTFLPPGLHIE